MISSKGRVSTAKHSGGYVRCWSGTPSRRWERDGEKEFPIFNNNYMVTDSTNDSLSDIGKSFESKLDTLLDGNSSKEDISKTMGEILEDVGVVVNNGNNTDLSTCPIDMDNLPDLDTLEARLADLQMREEYARGLDPELTEGQQTFCDLLDVASARLAVMPHPLAKVAAVACKVAKVFITPRNIELENTIKEQIDTYNGILYHQLVKIEENKAALDSKMRDVAQSIGNRHQETDLEISQTTDEINRSSQESLNNLFTELDNF